MREHQHACRATILHTQEEVGLGGVHKGRGGEHPACLCVRVAMVQNTRRAGPRVWRCSGIGIRNHVFLFVHVVSIYLAFMVCLVVCLMVVLVSCELWLPTSN